MFRCFKMKLRLTDKLDVSQHLKFGSIALILIIGCENPFVFKCRKGSGSILKLILALVDKQATESLHGRKITKGYYSRNFKVGIGSLFDPCINRNMMDLDQLPWFATFKLHRFIPSQRGDLFKINSLRVNAMGQRPCWPTCMKASYCTFRFGVICACYHYHVIHHAITYMRAWLKTAQERQLTLNEIA